MEEIYRQEVYEFEQAASGMILLDHRQLPGCIFRIKIDTVGSLKWVTERISKSVSNFKGTSS
jgi:hypothetical protein